MASSQRKGENDSNEQQVGEVEGDTEKVPLHSDNDDNQEEPPPAYNPDTTITIDNKNNTGNIVSSYAGTTTNTGVNEPLRRDNNAAPPSGVVTIPMDNLNKNANTNTNNTMYAGTEYKAGYNKVSQQAPAAVSTTAAAQATTATTTKTKTKTTHGGYEHAPHPPRGHYDNHGHDHRHNNNNNQDARYDDPTCLYLLAVCSIFIPLVGWIGMCAYQCGNGLGPRQTEAFKRLCLCTVIGVIIDIIYYSSDY